jgi:hypothetical protein
VHEHHLALKLAPSLRAVIVFEVEAFPEPKALSAQDLRELVKRHGGYVKAARAIGDVSEDLFGKTDRSEAGCSSNF